MIEISDQRILDEFLRLLKQQAKNRVCNRKETVEKYVYIDAGWSWIDPMLPKAVFAKGLQNEENYRIVFLAQLRGRDKNLESIADAIDAKISNSRDYSLLPLAMFLSLKTYLFHNNTEYIDHLMLGNVDVGIFLEEHLVRFQQDLDVFKRIRLRDLRMVIGFIWGVLSVNKLFRKSRPSFYLAHETDYWAGAVTKLALHYGARLFEIVSGYGDVVEFENASEIHYNIGDIYHEIIVRKLKLIDKLGFDYTNWAKSYYQKRFSGKMSMSEKGANIYKDRKIIGREQWYDMTKSDKTKKNIAIMAHCFSDAQYTGISKPVYRSFYDWLVKTLDCIKSIDNVNWILKAHPNRNVYGEGDRIYQLFEKYGRYDHVKIMKDEISTASLIDIIDGAVTVCGTCGVEFASHGIPVVCAGNAPYSGFGFTMDYDNARDYENQLCHMDELERLTQEQIDMARKVSYPYMCFHYFAVDEIEQKWISDFSKEVKKKERNDACLIVLTDMMRNGFKYEDSYYYKKGVFIAGEGVNEKGNSVDELLVFNT